MQSTSRECLKFYTQRLTEILLDNMYNHHSTSLHHTLTHSATYDVQDVEVHGGSENISIQCVFASGSQARGFHVEIRNSSTEKITSFSMNMTRSGNPLSRTAEQTVTGLTLGSYKVLIFDWERNGSLSSTPSYVGHVNVTAFDLEVDTSTTSAPPTTTSRIVSIATK